MMKSYFSIHNYCILRITVFTRSIALTDQFISAALALILVSGLMFPLLVRYPGTIRDTVVNAVLLSIAHLPKMLLVTGMNLLPLLLLVVLPQVFVFFSFLLPICGFALMAMYDLSVTDKIFASLEPADDQ